MHNKKGGEFIRPTCYSILAITAYYRVMNRASGCISPGASFKMNISPESLRRPRDKGGGQIARDSRRLTTCIVYFEGLGRC